jgi:voltage-gated potassium channel
LRRGVNVNEKPERRRGSPTGPIQSPPIRLFGSIGLLIAALAIGTLLFYEIGGHSWSLYDALYMAVNAVSTTGFRELDGMDHVRFSRGVTIALILVGLITVSYFQSNLTAVLVQGLIGERFRTKRMQKRVNELKDHIIVAGAGSTGIHVIEELHATRTPFVAIDRSREVLERIAREVTDGKMLYVVGEATDDAVLLEAGVTRCAGVVAALTEDKDNLFVTLSARSLNAQARIVTKVIAADAAPKMMRAGANATVSPNMLGGRRLASEIVRPTVVEFIDQMLHDKEDVLRLEEVVVPDGSWFVGRTLMQVPIRTETKLLVVALRVDKKFIYNPEPSTALEVGSVLVVLGAARNVARLRELVVQREAEGAGP